ncbi:hypothetical protein IMZ48_47830 [Candidatus Bathyarchaeota archaeon]|nr:hypothetical protein [Candidatus Bathyarchaeota archaeon]
MTEEEKKARDARRREREKRHRPSRPNRKVDLIDQLDMTSVYGTGGAFLTRDLLVPGLSPSFLSNDALCCYLFVVEISLTL